MNSYSTLESQDIQVVPFIDIHELFMAFNRLYFEGKLDRVTIEWSKRMTLCAGLCECCVFSNSCRIKLSQPLLSLRPVTDLVDTILHECIHAYLFMTGSITDHDAHGRDFIYHMNRINQDVGSHITIYHSFIDEVEHYRQHHWRCTQCDWVIKRAMNRPPSCKDPWWNVHQLRCNGQFYKVKQPSKRTASSQMLPLETYFSKYK
ncbi:SprT-like domain-containing protein Spartan [Galdieria sulphuraria]|uniref:SprT-like domain-containing protein n=1 Tax=Galdieria sulphuraria TaxID=130081 RepID=M2XBN2_GALSU|nr:uncharacterized protein Gasu_51520 [Galdieria sulphuraria]EME27297.1 hypothetical protein Gasu_51520 [Galdieria sulphuraria]GJD11357.1 SprT-like domain-containing protein Spartan [Galdieria sulphuraria]|eukprot:XP_005703817.1 hypothetical protein Gasu_51520 [Galdieria sulphuraria]